MKKFKFNLQLFAVGETNNAGTGVGAVGTYIQTTGDTNISAELKDFYTKDLIEMVGPNLIHAQFGEKVTIPKGHKRNIEFRKFSKFSKALTALTEGVTPAPHSLSVSTVTKELSQYGDYSILSDILELTAVDPIITEYTARHAENASLTLDTLVRNDLNSGTNVRYAQKVSSTGEKTDVTSRAGLDSSCILKVSDIAMAATDLKRVNAPKYDGSYVCIIHPSVAHDIITSEDWVDVNKYSNATKIFDGEIGKLYGVRFVESTEAKIFSNGSNPKAYSCLFLGKGAYKVTGLDGNNMEVIVKSKGSAGTADPLDQRSTIGWKTNGYGAVITIPEYILRLECTSTYQGKDEVN